MGTDIHAYIEYPYQPDNKQEIYWWSFGKVNLDRNSNFFGILFGYEEIGSWKVPIRGIPNKLGPYAKYDYWQDIGDFSSSWTKIREEAEGWVQKGSVWFRHENPKIDKTKVSDPDYYGAPWLYTEEIKKVVEYYNATYKTKHYKAINGF